ncbi:hypothetical protein F4804DRAFT_138851 [Jackrogersella minutella]|nr:hypothetical protein F4804DRAFT_138851 [Jackrogersella minutella]
MTQRTRQVNGKVASTDASYTYGAGRGSVSREGSLQGPSVPGGRGRGAAVIAADGRGHPPILGTRQPLHPTPSRDISRDTSAQPKAVASIRPEVKKTALGVKPVFAGVLLNKTSAGEAQGPKNGLTGKSKQSDDGNWVAPHLRHLPSVQIQTAEQASIMPTQTSQPQRSGNGLVQSAAATLELGRVLYCDEKIDLILSVSATKVEETASGRISLYELPQSRIVIWEIRTDHKVMRGDVRLCVAPFQHATHVQLRRKVGTPPEVQCDKMTFSGFAAAQKFAQALNFHRDNQDSCNEPMFQETVDDLRAAGRAEPSVTLPTNHADINISQQKSSVQVMNGKAIDKANGKAIDSSYANSLDGALPPPENIGGLTAAYSAGGHDDTSDKKASQAVVTVALCALADNIEAVPLGMGMSQESLRILSTLSSQDYKRMIRECNSIVQLLESIHVAPATSLSKHASVHVTVGQLMRDDSFKALKWDEQRKVFAVVYANVLHGDGRIIRSAEQLLKLRYSDKPTFSGNGMPSSPVLIQQGDEWSISRIGQREEDGLGASRLVNGSLTRPRVSLDRFLIKGKHADFGDN